MSANKTQINLGGGSMFTLFIVFMVLKLCAVIDWSWWFVTMPLWVPPAILVLVLAGLALFALFAFTILPFFVWAFLWLESKWSNR